MTHRFGRAGIKFAQTARQAGRRYGPSPNLSIGEKGLGTAALAGARFSGKPKGIAGGPNPQGLTCDPGFDLYCDYNPVTHKVKDCHWYKVIGENVVAEAEPSPSRPGIGGLAAATRPSPKIKARRGRERRDPSQCPPGSTARYDKRQNKWICVKREVEPVPPIPPAPPRPRRRKRARTRARSR